MHIHSELFEIKYKRKHIEINTCAPTWMNIIHHNSAEEYPILIKLEAKKMSFQALWLIENQYILP